MHNIVLFSLGQRPKQTLTVVTRDGKRYDLGKQVSGDDLIARFYQWRQKRKIEAYSRDRLKSLAGSEREEFLREITKLKEAHRG
jgi:hypothetical protein